MTKAKTVRPWIKSDGRVLCDEALKKASRSWNSKTWEDYLHWFERPRKENLINPESYDVHCDERTEPIYSEFGFKSDPLLQKYVEGLISQLSEVEENVIRLYFFEGLTEAQIATQLKRSFAGVHLIKKRAISRLRSVESEAEMSAIRIMKGLVSQNEDEISSPCDTHCPDPIRENRQYNPDYWRSELQTIENALVRDALSGLSDNQKRIVYWRFWCDQTTGKIARQLGIGCNVVQEICDAAVFKIKSLAAPNLNHEMEEASCV